MPFKKPTSGTWRVLLIACLFVWSLFTLNYATALESKGLSVMGVVTRKRSKDVDYTYVVDGRTYTGSGPSQLWVGEPIKIRYLPYNPSTSVPYDSYVKLGAFFFVGVTLLMGAFEIGYRRQQKRLGAKVL